MQTRVLSDWINLAYCDAIPLISYMHSKTILICILIWFLYICTIVFLNFTHFEIKLIFIFIEKLKLVHVDVINIIV